MNSDCDPVLHLLEQQVAIRQWILDSATSEDMLTRKLAELALIEARLELERYRMEVRRAEG